MAKTKRGETQEALPKSKKALKELIKQKVDGHWLESFQKVNSSNLLSVKYVKSEGSNIGVLYIYFKNERIYRYKGIPWVTYQSLITAESIGRFFSDNIKDRYTYSISEITLEKVLIYPESPLMDEIQA